MGISFDCGCGRHFETSEANAGKPGTCPTCGAAFVVPDPTAPASPVSAPSSTPSPTPATDTRKCPNCSNVVKSRARICRFCRHEFSPEPKQPGEQADAAANAEGTEPPDSPVELIDKVRGVVKKDKRVLFAAIPCVVILLGCCMCAVFGQIVGDEPAAASAEFRASLVGTYDGVDGQGTNKETHYSLTLFEDGRSAMTIRILALQKAGLAGTATMRGNWKARTPVLAKPVVVETLTDDDGNSTENKYRVLGEGVLKMKGAYASDATLRRR